MVRGGYLHDDLGKHAGILHAAHRAGIDGLPIDGGAVGESEQVDRHGSAHSGRNDSGSGGPQEAVDDRRGRRLLGICAAWRGGLFRIRRIVGAAVGGGGACGA